MGVCSIRVCHGRRQRAGRSLRPPDLWVLGRRRRVSGSATATRPSPVASKGSAISSPEVMTIPKKDTASGSRRQDAGDRRFADDFSHGERYLKRCRRHRSFPRHHANAVTFRRNYVIVKPLDLADPERKTSRASRFSSIPTNSPHSWFWRTIRSPILKMLRFHGRRHARSWAYSPIANWIVSILAH